MAVKTRKVRRMPGDSRCPVCRHYVPNSDLVEIIRSDKKKGKVVCTDCGINHLRLINGDLKPTKGPVQIPGQQSLI